jgi:cation diffusion facilitator CzcD-associated flavoprotein CzcO
MLTRGNGSVPRIAIIGGGLAGIAMGVRLRKAGIDDFTIFEAESGAGGTWWRNTYPGAEVDVHSALYSYSFNSKNWSRTHATQAELLEYIGEIIEQYGLQPHFRFNTRIAEAVWHEDSASYTLTTDAGESLEYEVIVSAVGFLSNPRFPDWEGLDDFQGIKFHTQYWDHTVELAGKRVAVVGNGSTATQVVPEIAPKVDQLMIFQREPGWILPKGDRDYQPEELEKYSNPLHRKLRRLKLFARAQWAYVGKEVHRTGSRRNLKAEAAARAYIARTFEGREDLKAAVTPQYPFSGKRRILQSSYYPTLLRDNVRVVPHPVVSVTPTGVVDDTGTAHDLDVLVMATGFQASTYLSTLSVVGRDGRRLAEVWKDGAYAFLGMTVPSFPNFYMLYGPNTNGGPILFHNETQTAYILRNIRRMKRGITSIDLKSSYATRYNTWLQGRLQDTAWAVSNNYTKGPSGAIVTQWPDGLLKFWLLHRLLRRSSSIVKRGRTTPVKPDEQARRAGQLTDR